MLPDRLPVTYSEPAGVRPSRPVDVDGGRRTVDGGRWTADGGRELYLTCADTRIDVGALAEQGIRCSAPDRCYPSGKAWAILTRTSCSTRDVGNGESMGNRSAPDDVR